MKLSTARRKIGAPVVYHSVATGLPADVGVITRVDDRMVWVRYAGSTHSIETHPDNLQLRRTK
jgi:hypothetical protein